MRKIKVKKQVNNTDELKLFVDEALLYAVNEFGWDNFIAEAYVEDDTHVILFVEKRGE